MVIKVGESVIDLEGLIIDGPSGRQTMEHKIMKLLGVLIDNAGKVMTREDLITAVWGVEFGGDERLSRGISILRKALGDKRGAHTHIVTISRVGYRFIAPIEPYETPKVSPKTVEPRDKPPRTLRIPALSTRSLSAIAMVLVVSLTVGVFVSSDTRYETNISQQAMLERGFSHVENFAHTGAIKDAQDIFGNILASDPGHAAARAGLALSVFREYTHLERDPALLQRAKAHAEAALRENEHLALANIAVAWSAEFDGKFERAHEYLDKADILDPDNMYALEGRYRVFGKQGQIDRAHALVDRVIETYPDRALFYTYRGSLFVRTGDFAAAETDLKQAISISPDSPRTYAQLAQSLHLQDRTDEAIEVIQQGLKINETALLYNNLGTYLFFQGQYDLAAPAFEKTLELSGDTHDYLYWANLGDAYRWSQNKKDEAATSYRRALQLLQDDLTRYPDDTDLNSHAAMINAKLGNLDEAQRHMENFSLNADTSTIQLYRAVVTYEILANRAKALDCLEAALAANYPLIEIKNDPELALLRQDPSYHRLLARNLND